MSLRASSRILPGKIGQVELVNHFYDKACQVVFREPVLHGGRKQIVCFSISDYEFPHYLFPNTASVAMIISLRYCLVKSDRLLGAANNFYLYDPNFTATTLLLILS